MLLSTFYVRFYLWRMGLFVFLVETAVILALELLWPQPQSVAWLKIGLETGSLALLLTLCLPLLRANLLRDADKTRSSSMVAALTDGVLMLDLQGRVEHLNHKAEALTGWSLADARRRSVDEVLRLEDERRTAWSCAIAQCLQAGQTIDADAHLNAVRRDGSRFGFEGALSPINSAHGQPIGVLVLFRDVSAKRQMQDELQLAASVFDHAVEGIIITNRDGLILRVNQAFHRTTGYSEDEVRHKNPRILSSGHHSKAFYQAMWQRLGSVGEWQGEVLNRRKNGEVFPEWLHIRAIHNANGEITHYLGIFSDISERIRDQEYIFKLAYYDSLTSVANRALLMDRLEMAIAQAQRHSMAVAVLFIDMDRFKLINDSLGHSVGDMLLQSVAQELLDSVRDSDTVSRFGGDEFVICLSDISGDRADAVADALRVAEKIQGRLSQTFLLHEHEVAITPSIGVALHPWDGDTPATLIKHADTAMYHAKSLGRDNVQLFSEAMLSAGSERLRIQSALRKAVDNLEFTVYYQAQIDLASGRIVGAEALLRWHNLELGWVSPGVFIPVAEDTSLIVPIGDWVMRQVCQDWKLWRELVGSSDALPRIALNFSPRQFMQPDFVVKMLRILDEFNIPPTCIEIEITEATLMQNTDMALSALGQLRERGIRIAVDDFGVGYSSLSYLKKFPIDVLKIDQSFIADICNDSNDAQIVRAIIAMGKSLHLHVLAEGVETPAQLAALLAEGCQEVQGYLFSRPLPPAQFIELLDCNWRDLIHGEVAWTI